MRTEVLGDLETGGMWMSSSVRRRCLLRERETEAEVEGSAEGLREVELEGPAEKVPLMSCYRCLRMSL